MSTSEPSPTQNESTPVEQRLENLVTKYGLATVTDTISVCQFEQSYSRRPSFGLPSKESFWLEVERRLEAHKH
jgi:hypothetical protein